MKHPIQPLEKDERGTIRFRANKIVVHLLDNGGIDMNALARLDFSQEDREQFAQLTGYSLSGFSSLSYASDDVYETAERMAEFNETEQEAELKMLRGKLDQVRQSLRHLVPSLFGIHPDDLSY